MLGKGIVHRYESFGIKDILDRGGKSRAVAVVLCNPLPIAAEFDSTLKGNGGLDLLDHIIELAFLQVKPLEAP